MVPFTTWLEEPARVWGQALVNGIWQGVLLTALIALVLGRLRRINAATRHAIWCATLVAVVALPVIAFLTQQAGAAATHVSSNVGALQQHPAGAARTDTLVPSAWTVRVPSGPWLVLLLSAALLVAGARLGRVAMALRDLRRLKRESGPLPALHRLDLELRLRGAPAGRTAALRVSDGIRTPVTIGFVHPAILLPTQLLAELATEDLAHITLHELSHVRRRDDWTNLTQRLAEAVFFFHPAVHWIGRRLDLERELACDDYAVAVLPGERSYARCLTHLAELSVASRLGALAPGAAPRTSQLARRVRALLEPNRSRSVQVSLSGSLVSAVVLLAGVVGLARVAPMMALVNSLPSPALALAHTDHTDPAPAAVEPRRQVPAATQPDEPGSQLRIAPAPVGTGSSEPKKRSAVRADAANPNLSDRAPAVADPVKSTVVTLEPAETLSGAQIELAGEMAAASLTTPRERGGLRLEVAVQFSPESSMDGPSPVLSASSSARYGVFAGPGAITRSLGRSVGLRIKGGGDYSQPLPGPNRW